MGSYVLAIDQGTTGSTVLILDRSGTPVGRAYSEFRQIYPRPGWVEHDAEEIWDVTLGVIRNALQESGIAAKELVAIGITNQRETTVIWDAKSGKPIHNAIVWQCRRTAPACNELRRQGREAFFRERTGLVLDAYFSGTKVQWLLDNVPEARRKAEQGDLLFGTIDSWLIWKLSGGRTHATDYTNATRRNGTKRFFQSLVFPLPFSPRSCRPAGSSGRPPLSRRSQPSSPLPVWPAISRQPFLARAAGSPAWSRTHTVPGHSCSSIPATRRSAQRRGC